MKNRVGYLHRFQIAESLTPCGSLGSTSNSFGHFVKGRLLTKCQESKREKCGYILIKCLASARKLQTCMRAETFVIPDQSRFA